MYEIIILSFRLFYQRRPHKARKFNRNQGAFRRRVCYNNLRTGAYAPHGGKAAGKTSVLRPENIDQRGKRRNTKEWIGDCRQAAPNIKANNLRIGSYAPHGGKAAGKTSVLRPENIDQRRERRDTKEWIGDCRQAAPNIRAIITSGQARTRLTAASLCLPFEMLPWSVFEKSLTYCKMMKTAFSFVKNAPNPSGFVRFFPCYPPVSLYFSAHCYLSNTLWSGGSWGEERGWIPPPTRPTP